MSTYYEFFCPVKICSGVGALENIPSELDALDSHRPMIITDKGVESAGLLKTVLDAFADSNMVIGAVWTDVPPDSGKKTVSAAAEVYRAKQCDALIAVGGGSVIDTAKGVNILVSMGGTDLSAYAGAGALKKHLNPLIIIPTTAGTGSEVTLVAVIKDEELEKKLLFVSPFLLPNIAVLDPRMTLTLPPAITAATAMDAMTHAIEAYTCIGKNPMSDAYAYNAIRLITENLIAVIKNPHYEQGRLALANAATMAGIAFSNSMVGLVHSLGHATGAVCHIPHGVAMNIFLPHVLEYNMLMVNNYIAELLLPLSGPEVTYATPESDRALKAIAVIRGLQKQLYELANLPYTLSQTGKVSRSQFDEIAHKTINDASLTYNPVEADFNDV
ncbi:MAG TPA: iron-containing alcohol dehydrogenase, partial [Spirochaetales bacterium]|nr:iron-containing alcohol dehydrogenase [Spirochaetales bacterium]